MARILTLSAVLYGFSFLNNPLYAQNFIADYSVAKEEVLRSIPEHYLNKARRELVIAYQHSSHGTHVSRGIFGLQDYKAGDDQLFGVSLVSSEDQLELRDYAMQDYAPTVVSELDLDHPDESTFIQTTRNYLDAPGNAAVNVLMWAWCSIEDHDITGNYLAGMESLRAEYGPGGSKIGNGPGQRELSVTFIYMTGHPNTWGNLGDLEPKPQADLINAYCMANQQFCLDYYSIDTHDMDDNSWDDAGEDGNSADYGGNFYQDWQDAHTLGEHWFENKVVPGGDVAYGEHTTQHITANRKSYAFWWILARIAGWDGDTSALVPVTSIELSTWDNITEIQPGDTLRFFADIFPDSASVRTVSWTLIQDTGTASLDSTGLLTAGNPGQVTVVATATDGSDVNDSLAIHISLPDRPVDSLVISSEGSMDSLESGSLLQFYAEVYPSVAANPQVSWSLIGEGGTATITTDGLLLAGDPGLVAIVASTMEGPSVSDTFYLQILPPLVPVESISISSAGGLTSLESGSSLQFTGQVLPEDASNPHLVWSVINESGSASISPSGLLTAGNPGSVSVVASAVDGSSVEERFYVTIIAPAVQVDSIEIVPTGGLLSLESGSELQLSATIYPGDASNQSIDWSLVNETGMAVINENGLLAAFYPGTVRVVAMARDGSGTSADFVLLITPPSVPVNGIDLSVAGGLTELESGRSVQFFAEILPQNASNHFVEWSVSEISGAASITSQGLFSAKDPGEVEVVASALDGSGISGRYRITILPESVDVISIEVSSSGDISTVDVGDNLQLYAIVSPSNASNKNVLWHVTGYNGVPLGTITSEGLFIALGEGKSKVLAIAQDGSGVYGTFDLTIMGPSSSEMPAEEGSMNIYPNPGSGLFNADLGDINCGQLMVINAKGAILAEYVLEPGVQVLEMDLRGQQPGIYFVRVTSEKDFIVKPIIIVR